MLHYIKIILVVAFLHWTGAQTSTQKPFFNRKEYLCKDDRVSDETLALLKIEDNKCQDTFLANIRKVQDKNDDCLKVADYSNDKINDQDNKYQLLKQCSAKYLECNDKKFNVNNTIDYQDTTEDSNDEEQEVYRTLMNCQELAFKTVFPPLTE